MGLCVFFCGSFLKKCSDFFCNLLIFKVINGGRIATPPPPRQVTGRKSYGGRGHAARRLAIDNRGFAIPFCFVCFPLISF
jgi:hypothetical protein